MIALIRTFRITVTAAAVMLLGGGTRAQSVFPEDPLGWPAVSTQNKPWTRWWWLGSAVDPANLTRELEAFAKAGLGGVEICPIYGAMGAEDRFIDFLSPRWMEMLAHTTREAERLGLRVDLTTGTGWPFGGPMVTRDEASMGLQRIHHRASGGTPVTLKLPGGRLQCLLAFPAAGPAVDLTGHVAAGRLDWTPPAGEWTISGIAVETGIQQVKRAAPGGEGFVLDPYSPASAEAYLAAFDKAFAGFKAPMPRAQFHDSFEYYGADWTPELLTVFRKNRGYDLRDQLAAFNGSGAPDTIARVRADYRETLGELHRDYLKSWHDWAAKHGGVTRNQAHGSPGNLLDHYAVSEIPETEIFRHVGEDQIPMLRFAASAAHANGGTLVSAESFTWLGEHFQVTPAALKEAADFVFLGGVNHLFFHGIPYSPEDARWPGWLFYASTHMGPHGGLWRDLPAFTGYLQRCQSILQSGKPDSEVLLYFPFADLIHGGEEKLPLFTVHNQDKWLHPTPFYQAAMEMWKHGVTFDFASDDMLRRATVRNGRVVLGGNEFKAIVLPGVKRIHPETLDTLARLAAQGGKILVQNGMPEDVPGFADLDRRREALRLIATTRTRAFVPVSGPLIEALPRFDVLREPIAEAGLRFVRRRHDNGHHYFIVNRGAKAAFVPSRLATGNASATVLDPWHPERPALLLGYLKLEPGQSTIVRTFRDQTAAKGTHTFEIKEPTLVPIRGPWKLDFTEGGPALPGPAELPALVSWTTLADPAAAAFAGTGRYSATFDYSPAPKTTRVVLDLGRVAHTARVSLNGEALGTSWCPPHALDVTGRLKPGSNTLSVEVTNLAANRIADLDRRKVDWKRFHEINFVNIDYQPFDASKWPAMESGLLGPVALRISAR